MAFSIISILFFLLPAVHSTQYCNTPSDCVGSAVHSACQHFWEATCNFHGECTCKHSYIGTQCTTTSDCMGVSCPGGLQPRCDFGIPSSTCHCVFSG